MPPVFLWIASQARNDGDLFRHHSFLQGIFHMPGAYCEFYSRYGFTLGKRPLTKELYIHGSAGVPPALNGIQGIGQIAITKVSAGV